MRENKIINHLKQYIGKTVNDTPSPVGKWLNGVLLNVEEGALEIEYTIRKEMTNPIGTLHGGSIAMILDEIIGASIWTIPTQKIFVSVNLSIDYLTAAKEGDKITAKSRIIRQGRSIINAQAELFTKKGRLIARATSNLGITPLDKEEWFRKLKV